jgi:type IV secretion system protein VirD4
VSSAILKPLSAGAQGWPNEHATRQHRPVPRTDFQCHHPLLFLVAGGLLSAFLSGHGFPVHFARGAITAFAHAGDPSFAWKVPVGPAWLYWTMTTIAVIGGGVGIVFAVQFVKHEGRRKAEDPTQLLGLADRHDVVAAAGAKHLVARGSVLRPSVVKPVPNDLGLYLGTSRRVDCYASVEDSMVILGPPRSGKGYNLVIPFILDAPGAVVTTSTRPDNLAATMTARARRGPVGVFDPQGLARGVSGGLRWSPIRGCEHPQTAMMRASALCAGCGRRGQGGELLAAADRGRRALSPAGGAVDGRTVSDLYRWSLSPDEAKEAVEILKASIAATPLWGHALGSVVGLEERQRANIWSVVSGGVRAARESPGHRAAHPGLGAEFHPATFLRENGTLYLLGTSSGASATANFVSALIEDVVETARQLAGGSAGARLDPPLALILDEAANYPLPSLGALMSEGGGTGITTVAVLQSLAQARDRWGHEQAQAIWDSAIAKVILGGSSNASDLRDIAQLIGERDAQEVSTTHQAGGGRNVSQTTRQRSILDPSMIRSIKVGHGLLMLRAAKPIMLTLKPWTARADAKELKLERESVEESLRTGALHDSPLLGGGIHA